MATPTHKGVNLLQNIARYIFESGKWFEEYHFLPANGPIKAESDTDITGFIFVLDPQMPPVNTAHGKVEFLQMFGITDNEIEAIKRKEIKVEALANKHRENNPNLITDLDRENTYV